ncbi:MAG: FG-GAP-like repeat-containing protein [Pyrinomonadaceae bacterium]
MKKKNNQKFQLWLVLPAIIGALVWAISPLISSKAANNLLISDSVVVNLQTNLSGAAINGVTPFGRAEYKVFTSGNRKFEVEAFAVNLPAGTALSVEVNRAFVGQLFISAAQSGELRLKTEDGQTVPTIQNGDTVTVKQNANIILSGIFGGNPTPSPSGSPSPSPSASPTASPSPTGSPSPSPSVSPSPSSSPGGIFARLTGATINGAAPSGFADYSLSQSGSNRSVRVYVSQVNLPAGTVLTVFVGDINVGQFSLQNNGGEFRVESRDNPIVPVVTNGTAIRVQNNGTIVLSGIFATGVSPSPSPSPSASPTPQNARFYEAELRGSAVVPSVATEARSVTKILLNQAGTEIQVISSFFRLSGNQTSATINGTALPGTNAPVIFNLGTIGGTDGFFPTRTFAVTAEQTAQLRAGLWYVVIGSINHTDGEIRGQISAEDRVGDFEGDGRTDIAVFRPSTGNFYFLNSSDDAFRAQALGGANDKLVTGDYDGDGITDAAVFRNINGLGVWEVRRSSDDGISSEQWGLASDIPVVGDFDGDGRSDLAVFRPSNGDWYIRKSSDGSFQAAQWGQNGDKPVVGDFDGDGRDDLTVFRPSTGAWYSYRSSNGTYFAIQWGTAEDVPQTGDFDGDGITDVAVFRSSVGTWYIHRSIDGGFRAVQFGTSGDIPAAGEFDADALTDIAVFRPSNGTWYIKRSVDDAFVATQFGANGDKPAIAK